MNSRRHRRGQRGQALLIFALTAAVLFAIVGLAVDAGVSYVTSAAEERAAAAAALAGVADMPNFNTPPNDASSVALATSVKNGYPDGELARHVTVDPEPLPLGCLQTPPCIRNQLQVTVTADVPSTFLGLLGFGNHRVARTAKAEYLRPITLGQPGNQLGSDLHSLGSNGNYYFMREEGWGTPRSEGDALTPDPNNTLNGGGPYVSTTPDIHDLNTQQATESKTVPGLLPKRGGYSYEIFVPPGTSTRVQVFNPGFSYDGTTCEPTTGLCAAAGYNYHENDSTFADPNNRIYYPTMQYSLFAVPNAFNHTDDLPISMFSVKPIHPAASYVSGPTGTWTEMRSGTVYTNKPMPDTFHNWVNVAATDAIDQAAGGPKLTQLTVLNAGLAPGGVLTGAPNTGSEFRVRVDEMDVNGLDPEKEPVGGDKYAQGHKGYAVRAVDATTGASCAAAGCTVSAYNELAFFTPLISAGGSNNSFDLPVMSIPPEYKGQTVSLYVFDPGDVSCGACTNTLSIVDNQVPHQVAKTPPNGGVYKLTSSMSGPAATATQIIGGGSPAAVQTLVNGSNVYNGTWLRYDIQVPANYNANPAVPSSWYWSLRYFLSSGSGADTITLSLGFGGAPVHLLQ